MIRFRCQECGKKLKAEEDIIGRQVKCTRCDNVETVPESDNLAKPNQAKGNVPEKRLETSRPQFKPSSFKSGGKDLIAGDEPVEMFGHSGSAVSIDIEKFEPRFSVSKPKRKLNVWRYVIVGLVGLGLVGGVVLALNFNRIKDAYQQLSTKHEDLEEVKYYRKAVVQLEKARHMMEITGKTYVMTGFGTDEEKRELEEYNASIQALTTKSPVTKEVEALFRSGEDIKARAKLVNTAVELAKIQKEVELKTKVYLNKTSY